MGNLLKGAAAFPNLRSHSSICKSSGSGKRKTYAGRLKAPELRNESNEMDRPFWSPDPQQVEKIREMQSGLSGIASMMLGDMSAARRTLEDIVGPPRTGNILKALEHEHCHSQDSKMQFDNSSHGIRSTPADEWRFVNGPFSAACKWPQSTITSKGERTPMTREQQEEVLEKLNAKLRNLHERELSREEFIVAVLWTGPMGKKYQHCIRGEEAKAHPSLGKDQGGTDLHETCKGNKYATTVHVLHAAVHKLSKLDKARFVYSGLSGFCLPDWLLKHDDQLGGMAFVELAFGPCTPDPECALGYAKRRGMGTVGVLFKMWLGPLDPGADLTELAQFKQEAEVILPPRCCHIVTGLQFDEKNNVIEVSTVVRAPQPLLQPLLSEAELTALKHAVMNDSSRHERQTQSKFVGVLQTAPNELAARGIKHYIKDARTENEDGVKAIEEEVKKYGNHDVSKWLHYVLYQEASEKEFENGVRDKGNKNMTIEDFVKRAEEGERRGCRLEKKHVVALRLYTTPAFSHINDPLRKCLDDPDKIEHPLPTTVLLIEEGIKLLRAAYRSQGNVSVLWRGMKDLTVDDECMSNCKGGTECAPMSTTSDIAVAAKYAASDRALLFKIRVNNLMQHGADLAWLSAFPTESEFLYPPVTYLQPTGRTEQLLLSEHLRVTVVEIHPHMS